MVSGSKSYAMFIYGLLLIRRVLGATAKINRPKRVLDTIMLAIFHPTGELETLGLSATARLSRELKLATFRSTLPVHCPRVRGNESVGHRERQRSEA